MRIIIYIFGLSCYSISCTDSIGKIVPKENIELYFPSLSKIIENIGENAPSIKIAKENVNEAGFNRLISDSAQGTSVNININGQSIHENRPDQDYYQSYRTVGSIFAKKPLYHWGALKAKSRIAQLSETNTVSANKASNFSFLIKVKSEFMDIVSNKYQLDLAKEQFNLYSANQDSLNEKKEVGIVTDLQVEDAKIAKLKQSILIAELERKLEVGISNFVFDVGYDKKIDFEIPKDFEFFSLNHRFSVENKPILGHITSEKIEQLKTQINIEKENLKIAHAARKPKLNLVGGFFQDQIDLPDSTDPVRRNNFLLGIEANWAIWDSSLSKGQKLLALAKKRKFNLQLENSIRKLRIETESLHSQIENLIKQIDASRKLLSSSVNRFEKSKIEFEAKRITSQNYLSSKLSLAQAKLILIQTIFNYFKVKDLYEMHLNYPK